jgi:hypothetical protein
MLFRLRGTWSMMSEAEVVEAARKRAREKTWFWVHLGIYIAVNAGLFVQWWVITGGSGFPWVLSTTLGWGIGIAAHFLGVFVGPRKAARQAHM